MLNFTRRKLLGPQGNCPWANQMVLNPAMIADPADPETLHMLFRATGAWAQAQIPGKPLPYPIFLGYAVSRNRGQDWDFDFSRPALAPRLEYDRKRFIARSFRAGRMFDYANGCIEDPRLFYFENQLYLTVACRAFPPGPYWEHDDPVQCMPEWALTDEMSCGRAVSENRTVTMLYRVDLARLAQRDYDRAFAVVAPLHRGDLSDDRDVVLFPRRLRIAGRERIVCLHRPKTPWSYPVGAGLDRPSIFMALGDALDDFYCGRASNFVLAVPEFPWEANRIGASFAPIETRPGEWLLPYHGKQDDRVGYTQSFMLLRECSEGIPRIVARPRARLLYATEPWELEGEFTVPCLFTCSGIRLSDGTLLMGYGAADQKIGLLSVNWDALLKRLRQAAAPASEQSGE